MQNNGVFNTFPVKIWSVLFNCWTVRFVKQKNNLLHFVKGRGNLKQKELNEEHLWQNRN